MVMPARTMSIIQEWPERMKLALLMRDNSHVPMLAEPYARPKTSDLLFQPLNLVIDPVLLKGYFLEAITFSLIFPISGEDLLLHPDQIRAYSL